jgi:hypothetical protein
MKAHELWRKMIRIKELEEEIKKLKEEIDEAEQEAFLRESKLTDEYPQ